MRYTRKDVSELLETVNGGPDVMGFSTSNFSSTTYTLVASGPGTVWQDLFNPAHRVCSEDGATSPYEDCR
ncbi:hypothetical protein D7Y13_13485 [Corallococcus praedator]|uniref:Uncharacterized protein n=1 Tax=Corallococcus praedator TaxID=2316724 RepID=A0ABX9QJ55_9BACT|nr:MULTISPECIES: hypothetical protein [Corallococcus]RKH16683.1 hypothetical protein D7X74_14680 [Corallococcus sp. CA047B]RKH30369.1 hypothetical protein D7X75_21200 [Corallococcus sp. CA031C]RKI09928.1 hypothetical protein D7Y13_13485 [Corallococcus praedator]